MNYYVRSILNPARTIQTGKRISFNYLQCYNVRLSMYLLKMDKLSEFLLATERSLFVHERLISNVDVAIGKPHIVYTL